MLSRLIERKELILSEPIHGYKVFNRDWKCLDKQYCCPGVFKEDVDPTICESGMHFCKRLIDCFWYYPFNSDNHVAEVIATGKTVYYDLSNKGCTNELHIIRELSWTEVLNLVNLGLSCTGKVNTGSFNQGDFNSGTSNIGRNSEGPEYSSFVIAIAYKSLTCKNPIILSIFSFS